MLLCVATRSRVCTAEQTSPTTSSVQTLVVRLVDVDGQSVEGAHVGVFAFFGYESTEPKDESGWHYQQHTVSDSNGLARITDDRKLPSCLFARHVSRKLVAIQNVSPEQFKETVTITMQPQCRIFGRLVSKELDSHNRKLSRSNVDLYSDSKNRPLICSSEQGEFHFYVAPGTYKLDAYSVETYDVNKTVTVQPGQQELKIEPINMPPKQWVLLEGQPAPALQDIVAWKNSGPIKLSNFQGKVVILEFWGYWCGPCMERMPELFSLYDKYREQGLAIISIHVDVAQDIDSVAKLDEKLAEIKKYHWNDRDIPFPVGLVLEKRVAFRPDVEQKAGCRLAAEYGIDSVPTGVIIDRKGCVAGLFNVGYKPDEAILEKVLTEKYVPNTDGK